MAKTCKHPDTCPKKAEVKGWCYMHWRRIAKHGDPGPAKGMRDYTPAERLERLTEPGPDGCILYVGTLTEHGYGLFTLEGKQKSAHRAAWILDGRIDPDGLDLHHICHVRNCVNPDHLEPVDPVEHRRTHNVGVRKEVCVRGHDLMDPANVKEYPRKGTEGVIRTCLRCRDIKAAVGPDSHNATCRNGHLWTKDTIQERPNGTRYCKTCANDKRRERRSAGSKN